MGREEGVVHLGLKQKFCKLVCEVNENISTYIVTDSRTRFSRREALRVLLQTIKS